MHKSLAGPHIAMPLAYRLQSFGGGTYMVTDELYQALFFVACESVVVVDAPPSIGENMVRASISITSKPISHVVYRHHHGDHISGAYLNGSPSNITYIAHRLTADELAATQDYEHRPPSATCSEGVRVWSDTDCSYLFKLHRKPHVINLCEPLLIFGI